MLLKHEKKEHGSGEKDYECSICGKKFFENRKFSSIQIVQSRQCSDYSSPKKPH